MPGRGVQILTVLSRRALVAAAGSWFGLAPPPRRRAVIARQMRLACEELGPTFIKLGQLASVRPDIFRAETIFELERLQDSVPPVSTQSIFDVIESEFGCPPSELFESIDTQPLASASIAQVHRARLAQDYRMTCGRSLRAGTDVAVKVVKSGIEETIENDLAIVRRLVMAIGKAGLDRRVDLAGTIDEFAQSLRSEVDLRNEGRVADRFGFDFRQDTLVVVPGVVWSRSTSRVLTMEYVEGWRLTDITDAERAGVDAYALALHGAEVFMRQVLVLGRFHADLHPANLFITPDSRICYLDFGIVGKTEPAQRIAIAQVLAATVYGDADRAIRYSAELGLLIPEDREAQVRSSVAALMRRTIAKPGGSDVRGFAIGFLSILADFKIKIPAGYGLLIKALVTVDGVCRSIYPDIDIAKAARPYATRLIAKQMLQPQRVWSRIPEAVRSVMRVISE